MKITGFLMAISLLLVTTTAQAAGDVAGQVGYMSGTLVAQRTDGTVSVLGTKSEVRVGDMLLTGKSGYAQILMLDGSRMTLRPDSNLRIESFHFNKEDPQSDNAVLRLIKGGFRTLTGLIGKRGSTDAYRLHAASATIGIRGTDFTSRLCEAKDCQESRDESKKQMTMQPPAIKSQVIGRIMRVEGEMAAKSASGQSRQLLLGAPVYEGDTLTTGVKSFAVVAFRDEGRITLQENTVFYVEKFKYDKAVSTENAVLRLLKGSVRVVTGLIGRINHENYKFQVAGATIGIRGTGFDTWCHGPCARAQDNPGATQDNPLDGMGVFVWAGEVAMIPDCADKQGACSEQIVGLQQAAIIARDTGKPVQIKLVPPSITDNPLPRPDSIPLDMEKLFGAESNGGAPGLYVTVHDGHVILALGDKSIDLGRGETGFSNASTLIRLDVAPAFMGGSMQINQDGGNMNSPNPSINPGGCAVQ
ncbi:MAG: FecR family protein [Gallionella sp.]|nr:FecR family protein [Gallionella sp.]